MKNVFNTATAFLCIVLSTSFLSYFSYVHSGKLVCAEFVFAFGGSAASSYESGSADGGVVHSLLPSHMCLSFACTTDGHCQSHANVLPLVMPCDLLSHQTSGPRPLLPVEPLAAIVKLPWYVSNYLYMYSAQPFLVLLETV